MKKSILFTSALLLFAPALSFAALITGAQNDTEAAFFENKKKIASWTFNADGSIQALGKPVSGEIKVFFGKGDRQRFVVYKLKESVIEDGTYTWTYTTGEPAGEESFSAGRREGPFKLLYKNGKISQEGSYSKGRKNGTFKKYYEKGGIAEEAEYRNGSAEGEMNLYYASGAVKEKYKYLNNRKHGTYQQYFESGTIKMEGNYKNDMREGPFFRYFESGEEAGIVNYSNGVVVSGSEEDTDDEEVSTEQ